MVSQYQTQVKPLSVTASHKYEKGWFKIKDLTPKPNDNNANPCHNPFMVMHPNPFITRYIYENM